MRNQRACVKKLWAREHHNIHFLTRFLITASGGRRYCPHFTAGETEIQRGQCARSPQEDSNRA